MSTSVPTEIRLLVREKLWAKATQLGWSKLSDLDRAAWYENWSKDKEIGGTLAHFMDPRKVRVYIKDALLKPYARGKLGADVDKMLAVAGLTDDATSIRKSFDKPHGRLLVDGRVICWGNSRDWKSILFSVFERAYQVGHGQAYAAVLIEDGKTSAPERREMIVDAGRKLAITKIEWVE